jgi:hypothetical protein
MTEPKTKSGTISQGSENPPPIEAVTPVIVEMGKMKRKKFKALKKGKGVLMDEVLDLLEEVAEGLGDDAREKTFVPVVMIYELKPGKKKRTIVLPF